MSVQDKIQKVASLLPPNKQIFMTYAQFQTVQQVPETVKSKFFDENLQQISRLFVEACYVNKQASQIDEMDLISDLEEWLSSPNAKLQLHKKTEPKIEKIQKKPQQRSQKPTQPILANKVTLPKTNFSPKPQKKQSAQIYNHVLSSSSQNFNVSSSRPQAYYQNPHPQGRLTTLRYTLQQPETSTSIHMNQHDPVHIQRPTPRRQHHQKQTINWVDSLSKCLTYPERRFYIFSQMHPKRKF